jgi:predicted lysophospholipase L1 biosynthesis ABC-type transport system permease subunit
MRVVGTAVVPVAQRIGMGAVTTIDGIAKLNSGSQDQAYFIRVAPGTDFATVLATFRHAFPEARPDSMEILGGSGTPNATPNPLIELDSIDSVPSVFALVMGLMAIAVLAHLLMVGTSAQRRDLAILRALGLSRGQTARTVVWQAAIYALVALAVGSPIGFLIGRLAWQAYARGLDVVPESAISWNTWAITAVGALILAALVALPAVGRGIRTRAATELHAD